MPQTLALLVQVLQLLGSTAGAGLAASWLFDHLRAWFPIPTPEPAGWRRVLYALLHAPRWARFVVYGLSAVISIATLSAVELLTQADPLPGIDTLVASTLAALFSQVIHARTLSSDLPLPEKPS
jgi:hypothetical protein